MGNPHMHRDLPISRWLYCGAAVFSVLPLLSLVFTHPFIGLPAFFGAAARGAPWIGAAIAVMVGTALWSLVRSANIVRAAWLIALAMYGQLLVIEFQPRGKGPIRIVMDDQMGVPGIEVSSNGVALGTTPLTLDETDYYQRVPAWDKPPDQPAMKVSTFDMQCYWSPGDPFQHFHQRPDGHYLSPHDKQSFMSGVAQYRYWWHFERDGFIAFSRVPGHYGGGGGSMHPYRMNLDFMKFVAVPEVVELLLEGLRESEFHPPVEWTTYVLRHRHLLFRELAAAAREDKRLEPVLDRLTRKWFKLPEEPSESDARRVMAKILDDVVADGSFTIPSVESWAIPWLARLCPQFIADQVESLLRDGPWSYSQSGTEHWQATNAAGGSIRREPLLLALEFVQPPELFETLVLLYAKQWKIDDNGRQLRSVLVRYPRSEGIEFLRRRMQKKEDFNDVVREITPLDLPELEPEFRSYISRNSNVGPWGSESQVWRFIAERIRRRRDLPQLTEWIVSGNLLFPDLKVQALVQIADPRADKLLSKFVTEFKNHDSVYRLAEWLTENPHPNADRFLLDLNTWLMKLQDNTHSVRLEQAILATDSPKIREYIAETARGDLKGWFQLVSLPPNGPLTHLDWLVPILAQSNDNNFRRASCRLLASIGTPPADALLDAWGHDPDPKLVQFAAELVRQREEAEAARLLRLEKLSDLLAGRITPQDLIALQRFVWKDKAYVEQE
jgi:hypothetical protein